jgi:hypothetical protein
MTSNNDLDNVSYKININIVKMSTECIVCNNRINNLYNKEMYYTNDNNINYDLVHILANKIVTKNCSKCNANVYNIRFDFSFGIEKVQ